ncbi:hypothetical protein [Fulvivirga sedimenti]|uniref:DUF5034 domain-containing protein n=1 Tax=Fulvivirga sedimenti TaxID=2879465 RepID=A0A9X1KX01_9BACT|nr:hypothetical protein [Fulvivirga sedimenti]MCA6073757.1 hypothetical protein [Fulvivirga sedimenti]
MVRKVIFVYVLIFAGLNLGGCVGDDCGEFGPYQYRLQSLESEITLFDFEAEELLPWSGGVIPFESFAIHFTSDTEVIAQNESVMGNKAYACSPPEPIIITNLRSVRIIADKNYNPGHPAGADLSALFTMAAYDYGFIRGTLPVNEWAALGEFIPFEFLLYPEVPPLSPEEFTFTIEFEFSGEGVDALTITTDPVQFSL